MSLKSQRKAQSALEFLTTYGWAFLVILIMIAALSYFGVLDPQRFLPAVCKVDPGFTCNGAVFDSNTDEIRFGLVNSQIPEITLTNIDSAILVSDICIATGIVVNGADVSTAGGESSSWLSQTEAIITITCPPGTFVKGDYVNGNLLLPYSSSSSSLTKRLSGQLSGVIR